MPVVINLNYFVSFFQISRVRSMETGKVFHSNSGNQRERNSICLVKAGVIARREHLPYISKTSRSKTFGHGNMVFVYL